MSRQSTLTEFRFTAERTSDLPDPSKPKLKIASLNCRGKCIDNKIITPQLSTIINTARAQNIDVLCLQETKTGETPLNCPQWHGTTQPTPWGAAILLLNNQITILGSDSIEGQCAFKADLELRNFKFSVISMYLQHDTQDQLLKTYKHVYTNSRNTLWAGDWNFRETQADSFPEDPNKINPPDRWTSFKLTNSLIDPYLKIARQKKEPPQMSRWTNGRAKGSRIDRIYTNKEAAFKPIDYGTIPIDPAISDHWMVWLEIQLPTSQKGPGRFISNLAPFTKTSNKRNFTDAIHNFTTQAARAFHLRPDRALDSIKTKSRKWLRAQGIKLAARRKEAFTALTREAHTLQDTLNDPAISPGRRQAMNDQLNTNLAKQKAHLLDKYEAAKIRSKARWAAEAESNTPFFFRLEQKYSKQKYIPQMYHWTDKNKQQDKTEDPVQITNRIKQYFNEELYKKRPTIPAIRQNLIDQFKTRFKLTDAHKADIAAPITAQEIEEIIKERPNSSSPGPDGLTYQYYKLGATHLVPVLTDCFNNILATGSLTPSMKESLITVLPKGDAPTDLPQNMRPITLTNCDYKLFTNVLAKRLGKILHELIGDHQTGFIPSRDIRESILNAQLLLDWLPSARSFPALLLLDWEKAFDRVDHEAIIDVIQQLDFPQPFVNAAKAIYSDSSAKVINFGYESDPFQTKSGTKQGCPLSPLIFVLMAELFLTDLKTNLHGIPVGPTTFQCQAYADDTCALINDTQNFNTFQNCVVRYQQATGAALNYHKSAAIIFDETDPALIQTLTQNNIEIIAPGSSVRYLGAPISTRPDYRALEQKLINAIERKAQLWHAINPTTIGRVLITKAKLLSKVWFFASTIPFSDEFINKLQSYTTSFIWKFKKTHKLNKWNLSLPKEEGGLNMWFVKPKIQALQAKWIAKYNAGATKMLWSQITDLMIQPRDNRTVPANLWQGPAPTNSPQWNIPSNMLRNLLLNWLTISTRLPNPGSWVQLVNDNKNDQSYIYKLEGYFPDPANPNNLKADLTWWGRNNNQLHGRRQSWREEDANALIQIEVNENNNPNDRNHGKITRSSTPLHQSPAILDETGKPTNLGPQVNQPSCNVQLYKAVVQTGKFKSPKYKPLPITKDHIKLRHHNLKKALISPTARHFEWLVSNHALQTNETTHKNHSQGPNSSDKCPYCPNDIESHEHRLTSCPIAIPAVQIMRAAANLTTADNLSTTYLLQKMDHIDTTICTTLRFTAWKQRNTLLYQGKQPLPNPALTKSYCLEAIRALKALKLKYRDDSQAIDHKIQLLQTIIDNT